MSLDLLSDFILVLQHVVVPTSYDFYNNANKCYH
jgi:hypothetical protein